MRIEGTPEEFAALVRLLREDAVPTGDMLKSLTIEASTGSNGSEPLHRFGDLGTEPVEDVHSYSAEELAEMESLRKNRFVLLAQQVHKRRLVRNGELVELRDAAELGKVFSRGGLTVDKLDSLSGV